MKKISRGTQVFLFSMVLYVAAIVFMLYQVLGSVDPRYRESAEESQVETAQLLASMVEQDIQNGHINTSRLPPLFRSVYGRAFSATIYGVEKSKVELRVYVTDAQGMVLYDSTGRHTGDDFSAWRDVELTLKGAYGARTSRDLPADTNSSVMYVGAPVRWQGEIVGMVGVGKPVRSLNQFVQNARSRIIWVGVGSSLALLALVLFTSLWFVRPFKLLREYARWLYEQPTLNPVAMVRQAVAMLRMASYDMRDAIAGRNYVGDYVQTLTHEFKSPLSGIRGAAELLQEPMSEAQRQHFIGNIQRDSQRIQHTIDRMLELTQLEGRRSLPNRKPVPLHTLLRDVVRAMQTKASSKHVQLALDADAGADADAGTDAEATEATEATVKGDAYLLERAISNVIDNAIEFSPLGTPQQPAVVNVRLHTRRDKAIITVLDHGTGVPDYAQNKVFDRFYSLPRPDNSGSNSNRKSTGLGLAFVREVVQLHGGKVSLQNRSAVDGQQGACVELVLVQSTS